MEKDLLEEYLQNGEKKTTINFKKIITKVLLSLIVFFSCMIYTSYNSNNTNKFKKYFFEDSFSFNKVHNLYSKMFNKKEQTVPTASYNYLTGGKEYFDGTAFEINGVVGSLSDGIVVFIGDKENYKNTIIVQGSNGYDIWYGNVEDSNIKIYDYVKKDTIIGNSDTLYIKVMKDDKIISYEDYLNV